MDIETKKKKYNALSELWKYYCATADIPADEKASDKIWKEVIQQTDEIVAKYAKTDACDFAGYIGMAFFNTREKEWKERLKKNV